MFKACSQSELVNATAKPRDEEGRKRKSSLELELHCMHLAVFLENYST